MSKRYHPYLETMGIQTWELRHSLSPAPDTAPAVQAAAAEPPEEPAPEVDDQRNTPEPPEPPEHVADLPAEYADWAEMAAAAEHDIDDLPPDMVEDRAGRIARMDWQELQTEVGGCTACDLHQQRTQAVFGVGDHQAQWMIIGEAPGADEDRAGEPFVGRSGKLLDLMLQALGLRREQVFIANVVKCRPPKNRDPLPEEVRCCQPFLERQIELANPDIILAVGRVAAQNLLQTQVSVGKLRGHVHRFGTRGIPLVVTYHPAYLLRSPREKRKAWQDLQRAHHAMRETG